MSKYTCITCQIAFAEAIHQRQHFQCDWHRYNLKRKVAELPPVSISIFQERILLQKTKVEEKTQENSYCDACKKRFSNGKSYANHINSKRHIENARRITSQGTTQRELKLPKCKEEPNKEEEIETDSEIEEVDSDEWGEGPIPVTDCLFCSSNFKSLEKNMKHMTTVHSFFVPDLQYCINLHRLIVYLGGKVGCLYQCLWCHEKSRNFWTLAAVQSHMRDKGHCMLKFEGETLLEYSRFYDYSSSYPDADNGVSPDAEVDPPQRLVIDGYELVLPSGATVGHRSLLRYYKQRLNPNRSVALHRDHKNSIHLKVLSHYKALGWKGETAVDTARRARDMNYMRNIESKKWVQLGVKGNKLRHHFRPQVMF